MTTLTDPFRFPSAASLSPGADAPARGGAGFGLFLVLTAILFVRPAEIVRSWEGAPLYLIALAACLLASAVPLLIQFGPRRLTASPAAACVVLFTIAIALSHLQRAYIGGAKEALSDFGKTLIYFMLLLAVVDTPERLGRFLRAIAWLVFFVAALALLHYHGLLEIGALDALRQGTGGENEWGVRESFLRLQATGLFSDPNDFSLALAVAVLVFGHHALVGCGVQRLIYIAAALVVAYAFMLTKSRGGFLGLTGGLLTYVVIRSGWRRAAVWSVLLLPLIAVAFAGRQTSIDINDSNDTAQGRLQLWRDGLQLFRQTPLFGIGYGRYGEEVGQVAHNSYVNSFVELGLVGGMGFVGLIYCAAAGVRRAVAARSKLPATLATQLPCVGAVLAAYAIGMCSLSRQYALPTYAVLGAAAAYCGLAGSLTPGGAAAMPLSIALVRRIGVVTVVALIGFDTFVRFVAK